MASTIGNVYIRIGADTKKLTGDLKAADRQIQAFGKKAKEVGSSMTQNVTLPIIGIGAGALKAYADLEALQKGLIAVMGSSSAASAEFEKLREVAKLPGLGLEEAARGSVSLQSAGFSADQAREALLQFGNALATVGKGKNELNLVVLALTQLQNKSSGFGQDLRQLLEQLPQMRTALVDAFGTADSEEIAKMGVTGKQVVEQLMTEFAKLPRVTGGLKNSFENASDSIKIAFANLGETLNKNLNIEGIINRIADGITRMSEAFSNLSPETQAMIISIAGIAAAAGPVLFVVGQLAGSFSAVIAAMKTAGLASTVALGPIGWAIAAIVAAIGILIYKWNDIKETLDQVGISVGDFSGVWTVLKGVLQIIIGYAKMVIDLIGNVTGAIVRFVAAVSGEISWKEFASQTIDAFKETGTKAGENFKDAFKEKTKNLSSEFFGQDVLGQISGGQSFKLLPNQQGQFGPLAAGFNGIPSTTPATKPTAGGGGGKKAYGLDDVRKELAQIDNLVKSGFLPTADALDSKLGIIEGAAKKFAEQGLKPTAKQFQVLKDISDELVPRLAEDIGTIPSIDQLNNKLSSVKDRTKEVQKEMEGIGKKIGITFKTAEQITAEYYDKLISKALESVKKVTDAMTKIGAVLNPALELGNTLLQNQLLSIDQKQQKERAAVEATVTNEDEKAKRLKAIDEKYDKEKKKIQRKQAIAAKVSGIFNAIVSAFEGAAKALALGPAGIPLAGVIKALGIANAAAIAAQPLPSLAVGTNMVKSDGLANIHKGEAIVPAKVVSGGYSGVPNLIQVVGKIAGTDIILGTKNSSELYNRMYA